jgi:hypothetical protein
MVYMSPDPYFDSFEQPLEDLRQFNFERYPTEGLNLVKSQDRVHQRLMLPGSPAAKTPDWHTRIRGTWLIRIGQHIVSTITEVTQILSKLIDEGSQYTVLTFTHPKICPNLTHDGIPIVLSAPFSLLTQDQLNACWEFSTIADYLQTVPPRYDHTVRIGAVLIKKYSSYRTNQKNPPRVFSFCFLPTKYSNKSVR